MTEPRYKAPRFRRTLRPSEDLPAIQPLRGDDAGMSNLENVGTSNLEVKALVTDFSTASGSLPEPPDAVFTDVPAVRGSLPEPPDAAISPEPSADVSALDESLHGFSFVEFLQECDEPAEGVDQLQGDVNFFGGLSEFWR